jgi:TolB-like protein/Flp pilus assembly protein TadD
LSYPLVFGRFELLRAERRLLDGGVPVSLGSRAFDLLAALVEHRDRVVSKDELLLLVWPGVVVEENNLTVHMSTLRKVLGADAVSTVSGRGYRFAMPVSSPPGLDRRAPSPHAPASPQALTLPDKPSIAVLPFSRLGGDAAHGDFIDGITDELITGLSRFRSLFVISRNNVFTYKDRSVDVRTVARELGVRYVLEGSVRREGPHVRVAVQLIDAVTGQHIWAERYDRLLEDVFLLQDEVAHAIVAAMAPHIETSEMSRVRSARPENITAYEMAQRAWARSREGMSKSNRAARDEALALARQALALDPRSSAAFNAIVDAQSWHIYFGTAASVSAALADGLDAAAQALAIDSADHLAYRGRGWLTLVGGLLAQAISDLRRSLELNPNDAFALARLGMCESVSGEPAAGTRRCLEALRLSPRDPSRFHLLDNLAWAHFASRSYAQAVDATEQSLREADFAGTRLCGVLSLVGLGEVARAGTELQALRQLAPAMVAARLSGIWLAVDPEVRQREIDFLQAANTHAPELESTRRPGPLSPGCGGS